MKRFLVGLMLFSVACSSKKTTLFEQLPASSTGISFNNIVTENDSINPMDMEFLYNGGGVAVGDFNNDSLPDLYFTASQLSNKLYLNKGNMSFNDVTEAAGVNGQGKWSNAASVVDINNDGLLDIYVCATIHRDAKRRQNLFYINQGVNENGIPVFRDMAAEYNLADTSMSVQAAFFDYDNDGDLDVYIVNTKLAQRNSTRFDGGGQEVVTSISDKLFRNDGNTNGKNHPIFTDVSKEAGIKDDGFGLGIGIADLNDDGWKDIYVTNDFFGSDLLYINQRNGTFRDMALTVLKHTSQSAMGNDIADINNDGLPDIMAVDMNPEDNYRKKKNLVGNNYFYYQSMSASGIVYQYVRNTLQLHNGVIGGDSSHIGLPVYSDVAFYAGVAETDWSWSPLLADFDNDGHKDMMVTNGYPKDVTDNDFIVYNKKYSILASKQDILEQIPQIKIPNYAYRNTGALKFENVTESWGLKIASFSAGAAYVDLDRDGDLDYVVSNINDPAFVFQNNSMKNAPTNYLNVAFKGGAQNINGLGAIVKLYVADSIQVMENYPYRGYLSSVEATVHFGLGNKQAIDSVVVVWPGGKHQMIASPTINGTLVVKESEGLSRQSMPVEKMKFFTPMVSALIPYRHIETDYIDFDYQPLLPHKLSEYGPCLAVADVDGNGLEDLFIGASTYNESFFYLQQSGGKFSKRELPALVGSNAPKPEVTGALLFDADADGDMDLYTASGSNEFDQNHIYYRDRFFVNDGKGNFSYDSSAIPGNTNSKSCVKAADYDNDGDLDLFVGSRLIPRKYPAPASSMIYRNDSKPGKVSFADVTKDVAAGLIDIGLVCDATWSDYDNDGWIDLMLAGEWMPLTVFHNEKGRLTNKTATSGLNDLSGWWTSIASGDFDNDGDVDYVAGNLGGNSYYRTDSMYPARMYAGDFGKNKTYMAIPALYLPDVKGTRSEFPSHSRNDVMTQLPALKKKYLTYKSFAEATLDQVFTKEVLDKSYKLTATYSLSSYIENKGNGKFVVHALPAAAQLSPLNGIVIDDVNDDTHLDIVAVGNDYGTEVSTGRYDALNGLVLLGDG
ncbi:MAG: VCBS repeat-containing protein, partial [Chitinophagaceae bacterium]|nr:VCBS repeat-containing protein [Chitinophagaceae bacterium]